MSAGLSLNPSECLVVIHARGRWGELDCMGRQGKLVPWLYRSIVYWTGCTAGKCLYMGVGGLSIATALYLVLCRSIGGRSLWRRHGGSYWRQG